MHPCKNIVLYVNLMTQLIKDVVPVSFHTHKHTLWYHGISINAMLYVSLAAWLLRIKNLTCVNVTNTQCLRSAHPHTNTLWII